MNDQPLRSDVLVSVEKDKHPSRNVKRPITDPAWKSPLAWILLLLVVFVGLFSDLASKSWAFEHVASEPVVLKYDEVVSGQMHPTFHESMRVSPWGLLDFHLVLNRGAVFGIGQGGRAVFMLFTAIAVVVAIAVFGWWTRKSSRLAHVGIAMILAGGIGNLYDRVSVGAVRDFLHMFPGWNLPFGMNWPGGSTELFPWVFNIADVLLLAGMALLLIHVHYYGQEESASEPS